MSPTGVARSRCVVVISKTSGILALSPRAREGNSCKFFFKNQNPRMSKYLLDKIAEIDSEVADNLKGKDNFLLTL